MIEVSQQGDDRTLTPGRPGRSRIAGVVDLFFSWRNRRCVDGEESNNGADNKHSDFTQESHRLHVIMTAMVVRD
jgi:hypothetical protein